MAWLDRLGAAKEIIPIGAVIGGEFSYELLHAVHPIREQDLQTALRTATDAELTYVRGISPEASYQFKHARIRDAAYEAILRSRRKELHSRIAEVLAERFPDTVTSSPAHLARHYTEAGLIGQAIPYWHKAGQPAVERSANAEAIIHFTKALELRESTPDSMEDLDPEEARAIIDPTQKLMIEAVRRLWRLHRAVDRRRYLCPFRLRLLTRTIRKERYMWLSGSRKRLGAAAIRCGCFRLSLENVQTCTVSCYSRCKTQLVLATPD
jgi:predicted ATPase